MHPGLVLALPDRPHLLPLQLLQEDILPALEKLRKERGQFMEWQAAEAKLSHLRRFCAAFRHHDSRQWVLLTELLSSCNGRDIDEAPAAFLC